MFAEFVAYSSHKEQLLVRVGAGQLIFALGRDPPLIAVDLLDRRLVERAHLEQTAGKRRVVAK